MKTICGEGNAGFEPVDRDRMTDIRGGSGGLLKKILEFIVDLGQKLLDGFLDGWNRKPSDCQT